MLVGNFRGFLKLFKTDNVNNTTELDLFFIGNVIFFFLPLVVGLGIFFFVKYWKNTVYVNAGNDGKGIGYGTRVRTFLEIILPTFFTSLGITGVFALITSFLVFKGDSLAIALAMSTTVFSVFGSMGIQAEQRVNDKIKDKKDKEELKSFLRGKHITGSDLDGLKEIKEDLYSLSNSIDQSHDNIKNARKAKKIANRLRDLLKRYK